MTERNNILIIGGRRGIGRALAAELAADSKNQVWATTQILPTDHDLAECKKEGFELLNLDPFDPTQLTQLSEKFRSINWLINCVGLLESEHGKPEKSLRDIQLDNMIHNFKVNSALTPLLAKTFVRKMDENSVFAILSAKVGSIEDNQMGGWYSYRASKAALNMFIKNIAIEFNRRKISCRVLALHPGTTETDLSKNYLKNFKLKIHSADQTARNMIKVIQSTQLEHSGSFLSWDGSILPW